MSNFDNYLYNDYNADRQSITSHFRFLVRSLNFEKRRLGGRYDDKGYAHGLINNIFAHDSWVSKYSSTQYYKCFEQAIYVAKEMKYLSGLRLTWMFVIARRRLPSHYWVEAIPVVTDAWKLTQLEVLQGKYAILAKNGLPGDFKVLVLDPWLNEVTVKSKPTGDVAHYFDERLVETVYF